MPSTSSDSPASSRKTVSLNLSRGLASMFAVSAFLLVAVQPWPSAVGLFTGGWRVDGNMMATVTGALLILLVAANAGADGLRSLIRIAGVSCALLFSAGAYAAQPWIVKSRGSVQIYAVASGVLLLALVIPYCPGFLQRGCERIMQAFRFLLNHKAVGTPLKGLLVTWFMLALLVLPLEFYLRTDHSILKGFGRHTTALPARLIRRENSLGFCDAERTTQSAPGVYRILVLGDSITRGHGIASEERYTNLLQAQLGDSVEVINMSRNGWSTADHLRALKNTGLHFQPDLLVIGICINDVEPPAGQDDGLARQVKVFRRVPFNLAASRLADEKVNTLLGQLGWSESYYHWLDAQYREDGYLPEWRATVTELGQMLKQEDLPAIAITLPSASPRGRFDILRQRHELLAENFRRAGIEAVNLWPEFEARFGERPPRSLWAIPNDGHPNQELHAFYAEMLLPRLRKKARAHAEQAGR